MKTISPYLITKLYTWTIRDLELIYNRCFEYNQEFHRFDGPSSTFAMTIAALMETWGSIMRDKFGNLENERGATTINTEYMLEQLYKRNPENYEIYNKSKNKVIDEVAELFRHNLIHNFGKNPKSEEFDLNIDCEGKAINQQPDNKRWHINCKLLKEDFLNLLRIELPKLLKE